MIKSKFLQKADREKKLMKQPEWLFVLEMIAVGSILFWTPFIIASILMSK